MKKILFYFLCFFCFTQVSFAQQNNFQLSSHVLDITSGTPASNVKITLHKKEKNDTWKFLEEKITDKNGAVKDFLKYGNNDGIYKLTFYTSPYFTAQGHKTFYPYIEVIFEINGSEHFHVPITLSPFGYSTYRGN